MRKIKYIVKTKEQVIKQRIIIYTITVIMLIVVSVLCAKSFKNVQAISVTEETAKPVRPNEKVAMEENKHKIDVNEILKENTSEVYKKTLNIDEVDLDYTTEYIENSELPSGTIQVKQEGTDGKQMMVIIKTYAGNEYISEERIEGEVTQEAINKIVEIGTGEGSNNYTPKSGDSLWTTPERVKLRESPNKKATEICDILKDSKVVVMEVVNNNWIKIQVDNYIGYSDSACFTNINPNGTTSPSFNVGIEYSKEELLSFLDINMDLTQPSGLTIDQFKKVLTGNSGDTQGVLASNAEYFYYAERQYGVNGIFLASMAIHEGGWGTSNIANDKKNLFGYGAYDSDPYGGAMAFDTYAEGIDLVARVLAKTYLYPAGTDIYDGLIATGTYYNGPTLAGVNTRYASDKNWANGIFRWMSYLYNRL